MLLVRFFKWQFGPAIICLNVAFSIADRFPMLCVFIGGVGLTQVVLFFYQTVSISPKDRAVLITGCDSGFGHLLAERLHAMKFTVFACCLTSETSAVAVGLRKIGSRTSRMHVIQMDVTSQKDVDRARKIVEDRLPKKGLWGIVNNASCYRLGFLEWLPLETYESLSSVNVCGVMRVTKAFLPLICRSRGRIVNVSSILGRVADPFLGAYCISKFAMKAFSDILRLEINPLKVKVSLIEPGNFMSAVNIVAGKDGSNARTRQMWNQLSDSVKQDYGEESLSRQTRLWEAFLNLAERDIGCVINAMSDALCRLFPKYRYFEANLFDRTMACCIQFLPTFLSNHLRLFFHTQLLKYMYD
ncbi:D-beta-hydroxybutyrate dehydrogenase, mitochondrial-like isoform X2 [Daphnia pulicaria]|uniref:D-beta-hydroxybutyrate dehydrogenase, mitochondrial-like isoform X2 n=1 Tax=Daphnia pulicaria TaxID=35523 RepID=UPI001EEBD3F0|nr:D-beta-hydroxybutyrate dehydrogenase, mitochondrial-like isoform X2 [Daphnia pulicaria]